MPAPHEGRAGAALMRRSERRRPADSRTGLRDETYRRDGNAGWRDATPVRDAECAGTARGARRFRRSNHPGCHGRF